MWVTGHPVPLLLPSGKALVPNLHRTSDPVKAELNNMSFSAIFARIVALIGGAALLWRRMQGAEPTPAWGSAPTIPAGKPQGAIPTLKMPAAQGWAEGQKPVAAPGLQVN